MAESDEALVRRWQRGDLAAFEAIVRRWQIPIARLLARLLGADEQIQDLCQDVFLRVFLAGSSFRGEAAFGTWIYQIALNKARDAGRRRKRVLLRLEDQEPIAATPVTNGVYEQKELASAVTRALAALPEQLREVLVLRHYEDMNFEAIARLTGTPASTLKSRFAVALARLREHLRSFDDTEELP